MSTDRGPLNRILFFGGLAVAFGTLLAIAVFGMMRRSEAYKLGWAAARADSQFRAVFGSDAKPGLFVAGQIKITGPTGFAKLSIPVRGRTSGRLYVNAEKDMGRWHLVRVEAEETASSARFVVIPPASTATPAIR